MPGAPAADGIPVTLLDGGARADFRVSPGTVLDLLRAVTFPLGALDRVDASLIADLVPGMVVRVIRGAEWTETAIEAVPAPTTYLSDATLSIGETRLLSSGRDGAVERSYRVRSEDGAVVERQLLSETVLTAPVAARIARGTKPIRLDTPYGTVSYVRALNVLATYYTPANCGKSPDSPWYGITATGARATRGIVAVDPRVIPLYSWLYVPGYGIAQARDVGSAIIGNHIDVAFDDGDGAWWGRRFLTVYVLAR
jgi:3D (Asp-Asp-Asp) domain-containing protein